MILVADASTESNSWIIPVVVVISSLMVAALCVTVVVIFRKR